MQSGIFQQVHQHLLDQHGIHGDHDKGIRRFQLHRDLRVALAELDQHRIQQFVQHSGGLLHRHLLAVDAGDGKQILHHAGQPLGIAAGFAKQFNGLFLIQRVIIFDHSGAGTVDGGERGAQIVRNRAQKICTHLLLLAFHTQLFLFFDAGGEGAGHDGHTSITRPENRFSDRVKLKAKYGERKAKFTASTLMSEAATPHA